MGKNEKLQHRWSILCRESSIDSQTNNISLFNILEQVGIDAEVFAEKKGGAIPMNLELVTLWEKQVEEEGVDAEVEVELQDQQIMSDIIMEVARKVVTLPFLNAPKSGCPAAGKTGQYNRLLHGEDMSQG